MVEGSKVDKSVITCLSCCNISGNSEFPIMIIENSKCPFSFKRKSGQELGFYYQYNLKSWMKRILFFEWLDRFNNHIKNITVITVLILLFNCSAHCTEDTSPSLTHVTARFLPPRTTNRIQPCDAGIISCVKEIYKKLLLISLMNKIDINDEEIYAIYILTDVQWITRSWDEVKQSTDTGGTVLST